MSTSQLLRALLNPDNMSGYMTNTLFGKSVVSITLTQTMVNVYVDLRYKVTKEANISLNSLDRLLPELS